MKKVDILDSFHQAHFEQASEVFVKRQVQTYDIIRLSPTNSSFKESFHNGSLGNVVLKAYI